MANLHRIVSRLSAALAMAALAVSIPMTIAAAAYEAPPAASGSIALEDLGANIDLGPSRLPTVPEPPEDTEFDPERDREELRARVQMELDVAPEVDTARVLTYVTALGRVRLTGVVADESAKTIAEGIAAAVPGVTGVDNQLRVEKEND